MIGEYVKISIKYREWNYTKKLSIKKISGGVIEVLRGNKAKGKTKAKKSVDLENMTPPMLDKRILELKELMKDASRRLEFEKAAKIRDEIKELTQMRLVL